MRPAWRIAAVLCLTGGLAAASAGGPAWAYTKSSITIDAHSGLVLQAHNADARHPPASLSKLMTLYLTFEAMSRGRFGWNTRVRISRYAARRQPSKLYLRAGQRVKVLLLEVNDEVKGPQVIVSRGHRLLLRRLLEVEVPEIAQGRVEVKAIAREGGHRSKVAVHARAASVDPIGACVGMRGSRIQNVVNELGGERVDIIKWDPDAVNFVTNALSPAQVLDVHLDEDSREAVIVVPDSMLSLAIGKEGQNARLAAKLSGYRISIRSQTGAERDGEDAAIVEAPAAFDAFPPGTEPDLDILQLPDEPLPPIEIEVPRPAAVPAPAAVAAEAPAAVLEGQEEEEDLAFPAALAEMEVPDEATREAEDYGEEEFDEEEGEEYTVPTLVVPEERPTAIRFAEDVLPAREEEEQPRRRRRRGPRVEEDDFEDDIDYSGRIH